MCTKPTSIMHLVSCPPWLPTSILAHSVHILSPDTLAKLSNVDLIYFLPSPLHPSNIFSDGTNCVLTVGIRLWHYPTIEAKIPENPDQNMYQESCFDFSVTSLPKEDFSQVLTSSSLLESSSQAIQQIGLSCLPNPPLHQSSHIRSRPSQGKASWLSNRA